MFKTLPGSIGLQEVDGGKMSRANEAILVAIKRGFKVDFKTGDVISPSGRILKAPPNSNGYRGFSFYFNKKTSCIKVHRIIGYFKFGEEIFKPGMMIRHLDNNKLNNTYDNLGIGTMLDNARDCPPELKSEIAKKGSAKRKEKIAVFVNYNGVRMPLYECSQLLGIHVSTLHRRIKKGWPEKLLFYKGQISTATLIKAIEADAKAGEE